ncbi:MAG: M23 family metallopeptidase [Clostridia bacterium]|nr:M23 family metallopeptidase [Clostridia bacterium]
MQEQKDNEKEMQKTNDNKKKKPKMDKEKKFYLFTAIGCAAVLIAIIIVAVAVNNAGGTNQGMAKPNNSQSSQLPSDDEDGKDSSTDEGDNKPVVSVPEGMVLPIAEATAGHDYGFYHNQTLDNYYVHKGVDFMASAGTQVVAVEDGVIESIYKDDILLGTEITVAHENGLKSVYRFVTELDDLRVGQKVEKGQAIATVAEPTGNEYKDGAHLHFEILENGQSVDPTLHLTMEEK